MLYPLAEANGAVFDFLVGPVSREPEPILFELPEQIPDGQRTTAMVKLVCSQQAKGLSDEAIRAAVRAENEAKCVPPLTDQELEREVFPALTRYQKGTAPYTATYNHKTRSFPTNHQKRACKPCIHGYRGRKGTGMAGNRLHTQRTDNSPGRGWRFRKNHDMVFYCCCGE